MSKEPSSITLWITSDIEGYLVGCDCPSGASAGLSAVAAALESRDRDTELLLDAGGFREAMRSDFMLEAYMDEAVSRLGYSGMTAVSSDFRDGNRAFNKRSIAVPVTAAAGTADSRFLHKLTGEDDALILHQGNIEIAVAQWAGIRETELLVSDPDNSFTPRGASEVIDILKASTADFRFLIVRGSLDEWDSFLKGVGTAFKDEKFIDLIIFTGPDSPSSLLSTGGLSGELPFSATMIPWLSIAPRGNGLARLLMVKGEEPELEIISLERGISLESTRILALGDAYMEELIARVTSGVSRGNKQRNLKAAASDRGEPDFEPTYWYPYACKSCENFLWNSIPDMERESGRIVSITERDTGNTDDFDELLKLLDEKGIKLISIPVMIIGDTVLQGDEEIYAGLESLMKGGSGIPGESFSGNRISVRWEPGAIFLAGLLDGVNPCAFTAMVFLVSALAMAGRSKKMMLAIGMFYAAGIFITYSLIGAGLLGGLRRISVDSGLRLILEYSLAGFLLVLSALSLVDGIKLSNGRSDLLLKLPEKLSRRVHKLIREEVRSGAAAGSAFMLGAVVALIELGCTGQVYLPTIAWMISRGDGAAPWLWLAIYNFAFIIPLFIVFAVSYKGVSALRLAAVFRKRGALIKFITAGLLAALSVLVIIT